MPSFEEIQKARILNSFNTDEGLSELTKAEILDIEKGGKRAMIGEKRTFAGREYIKTSDGWKFHGKGTGSKAQSHVAGALEHHVGEKKEDQGERFQGTETPYGTIGRTLDNVKLGITHEGKEYTYQRSNDTHAIYRRDGRGKQPSLEVPIKGNKVDYSAISTHKDATDHFVEDNGKHYIDILDPDSGEKKFKPGDKVKYKDDSGKQHKGTISDREHEDGDMFEVDREGDEKESKLDLSGHSDEDLNDAQMARLRGGMSENHPEMKQIQAEKDKRNKK